MKLEHGNCNESQLAEKLSDQATAEKALKAIEGWDDGPSDVTTSIKDPSKTVLEFYQSHNVEIRCPSLPVLLLREHPEADVEQIPIEYLDVYAPIIATKRSPLPWMRGTASGPQNDSVPSGGTTTAPPAADLSKILGELEELKNKTEMEDKEKKLQGAQSEVERLRSQLNAYQEANPKAALQDHAVLNKITADQKKAQLNGTAHGSSTGTAKPAKAAPAKPTSTSA